MKQALITFVISFSFAGTIFSQINLVIDPSMEDTTWGRYANPADWAGVSISPDRIYIGNVYGLQSAPQNIFGYEFPRTGNSYYGIDCFSYTPNCNPVPNKREIIQGRLISPLKAGKKYCVEFWVSMADSISYAVNNLGAYFSDTSYNLADIPYILFQMPFNHVPQIINNGIVNPLTNKAGWTKVAGSFIAKGGEKYILIGNFNTDANTDTVFVPGPASTLMNMCYGRFSYYYIDDVSVYCCDVNNCELTSSLNPVPTVFTPNNDGINDVFKINSAGLTEIKLNIYNRWGTLVYSLINPNDAWDGSNTSGEPCTSGVYFYFLSAKGADGKEYSEKGYLHLLR